MYALITAVGFNVISHRHKSRLLLIRPAFRQDFTAAEQVPHGFPADGAILPSFHHRRQFRRRHPQGQFMNQKAVLGE